MKSTPTSYWTFFCNPAKWAIDSFLRTNKEIDDYMVTGWQADWFQPGQLGVVRVGVDKRTKEQLGANERLFPGIYAVVEILGVPKERTADDAFWLEAPPSDGERLAVDIRYLKNLLDSPLLLEDLRHDPAITDKYLLEGFQAASMPLDPGTFNRLVALTRTDEALFENIKPEPWDSLDAIASLESKYANASPPVKQVISKRIERGPVGEAVKVARGFRCQVCEALNLDPIGFRKPDSTPYVEAHHVTFVSSLQPGTLGPSNLITACPNHHRQLHYGDAQLLETTKNAFRFRIDGTEITIPRLSVPGLKTPAQ